MTQILNLNQLATFVLLTRERSFTRTADALHLTQPAVTQQIRALERDVGVALVDVVARRVEITDAGVLLAERAERLLAEAESVKRDMREMGEARSGMLHLAATITIGGWVLPEILRRFGPEYPGISLDIKIGNTEAVEALVREGTVSLALVEGRVDETGLEVKAFANDELFFVVAPDHRLAKRRSVDPKELAGEHFIAREVGSGTRELFERALLDAGVVPHIVLALPAGDGIINAVVSGLGIGVLSRLVVEKAMSDGRISRLRVRGIDLHRTFRLVRRQWRTIAPAATAFENVVMAAPKRSS